MPISKIRKKNHSKRYGGTRKSHYSITAVAKARLKHYMDMYNIKLEEAAKMVFPHQPNPIFIPKRKF